MKATPRKMEIQNTTKVVVQWFNTYFYAIWWGQAFKWDEMTYERFEFGSVKVQIQFYINELELGWARLGFTN